MKKLKLIKALILLLIISNANSQNDSTKIKYDCDIVEDKIDEFTKIRSISLRSVKVGSFIEMNKKNNLEFDLTAYCLDNNKKIFLWIEYNVDLGCLDDDSYIHILFNNGEALKLSYYGKVRCNTSFMKFLIKEQYFDLFLKNDFLKVRISADKYYKDIDIDETDYFIKNLPCLIND